MALLHCSSYSVFPSLLLLLLLLLNRDVTLLLFLPLFEIASEANITSFLVNPSSGLVAKLDTPMAEKFLNSESKIDNAKNRHPMKQIGSAQDISEMVKFLLSEKSKWMTGQIIPFDGGISSLKTN